MSERTPARSPGTVHDLPKYTWGKQRIGHRTPRRYKSIGQSEENAGSTALLGQQTTSLDAYVRQRIRRSRLSQRGGSKTYRRANMLSIIYTHERLVGAGLRYAERIIRDAPTGQPLAE